MSQGIDGAITKREQVAPAKIDTALRCVRVFTMIGFAVLAGGAFLWVYSDLQLSIMGATEPNSIRVSSSRNIHPYNLYLPWGPPRVTYPDLSNAPPYADVLFWRRTRTAGVCATIVGGFATTVMLLIPGLVFRVLWKFLSAA